MATTGGTFSAVTVGNLPQLKQQWPHICREVESLLGGYDGSNTAPTELGPLMSTVNQLQQQIQSIQQTRAVTQAGTRSGGT